MDIDLVGGDAGRAGARIGFSPCHRNAWRGVGFGRRRCAPGFGESAGRRLFGLRFGKHVVGVIRAFAQRRTPSGQRTPFPPSRFALAQKIGACGLPKRFAQSVRGRVCRLYRLQQLYLQNFVLRHPRLVDEAVRRLSDQELRQRLAGVTELLIGDAVNRDHCAAAAPRHRQAAIDTVVGRNQILDLHSSLPLSARWAFHYYPTMVDPTSSNRGERFIARMILRVAALCIAGMAIACAESDKDHKAREAAALQAKFNEQQRAENLAAARALQEHARLDLEATSKREVETQAESAAAFAKYLAERPAMTPAEESTATELGVARIRSRMTDPEAMEVRNARVNVAKTRFARK